MKALFHRIKNTLGYLWRLLGVILAGSFFWSGGTFLCLVAFPILRLVTRSKETLHKRARLFIHYTFKTFLWFMGFWRIMTIEKTGLSPLKNQKSVLLICNHPGLLDTVIIMAHFKNIQCIIKKELHAHPVLRNIVKTAGYIPNDLPPEHFLQTCKEQLEKGERILIFPEGTRTKPGMPIALKRGLSNLAIATNSNIQPLTLEYSTPILTKGHNWYIFPQKRVSLNLKAGQLFKVQDEASSTPRSLHSRSLTREIEAYYNRHLGYE